MLFLLTNCNALHTNTTGGECNNVEALLLQNVPSEQRLVVQQALQQLRKSKRSVDTVASAAALQRVNDANAATMQQTAASSRFCAPAQTHHGRGASLQYGDFPVTSVMGDGFNASLTLNAPANGTVQTAVLLHGCHSVELLSEQTVLCNAMPTTLRGSYTGVPSAADYAVFRHAAVKHLREQYGSGICSFDCISQRGRADVVAAIYQAGEAVNFITLVTCNGSKLELHVPAGKQPVLLLVPGEHHSHITWQAMKEETRLWQLEGLVAVYSARASVLGSSQPLVEQLISIIGSKKHVGWYSGGAAIGAYCRSVVRMRFHYAYGAAAGENLFNEWYSGFCRKGGTHVFTLN
jgi:hypothetical protein